MKTNTLLFTLLLFAVFSCSKNVEYSEAFKKETSGKYLYTQDDLLEVYYEDNDLYLKWRGAEKIKPVVLSRDEFFVADMYKKLRFTKHPDTKEHYISIVPEEEGKAITYDYLKVSDNYKTPSQYLQDGNYEKALQGFLKIKQADSTSIAIRERSFNQIGYDFLRDKKYEEAIEVFIINKELYPNSSNVYDSLADAYLRNGDSLKAYENYSKSLELGNPNMKAINFVDIYRKKLEE
ncbi:tetratricopeptide repeat protein [Winogradskyella sp. SYSU M77433]|uniref:tetratricopeptide repeat protein n=1 Tax=Winogradskyella sp. SYSU M77433 TaxID=3042722 RepID=UPI00247FDB1E|nr:tetratricopeptide repeat protein [Winogradskyella sp. SYSU M77433]MDH7912969.1 tetratricopeptide repeat protein [Winogradskyella sp. SYSU M77433]